MHDSTDIGTSSSLPVHVEIPGYRLRHVADSDSIGILFSAEQESLGRKVTLKVLKPKYEKHPTARKEFLLEMDRLGDLDHPNLPRVLDSGRDGLLFLVTERVGSRTLADEMEDGKPMAEGTALSTALGVTRGLEHLLSHGLAHKNVTPRLIALHENGCRLVTFRNVVPLEELQALRGRLAQDPNYVAPEQLAGEAPIGPKTHVYHVGALLFHLLAARPPFTARDPKEVAKAHFKEDFPSLKRLQPFLKSGIHDVVAACTQRDPDARPSIAELIKALEALVEGREPGIEAPKPTGGGPAAPKPRRRRRRRW